MAWVSYILSYPEYFSLVGAKKWSLGMRRWQSFNHWQFLELEESSFVLSLGAMNQEIWSLLISWDRVGGGWDHFNGQVTQPATPVETENCLATVLKLSQLQFMKAFVPYNAKLLIHTNGVECIANIFMLSEVIQLNCALAAFWKVRQINYVLLYS